MVTVSVRKLSKKDYEGIVSMTQLIPLINFKTPPEETGYKGQGEVKDGSHGEKLWWMGVTEEVGTQSW